MIIDTHCHLDDESFDKDLDAVIQKAFNSGVKSVIIPGANLQDLPKARDIAHRYENVFFAAGIHPYHIDNFDIEILKEFLKDSKCIAVGECGLDYFRLPKDEQEKENIKSLQKRYFGYQIELAMDLNKPLIIHAREANEDIYQILLKYKVDFKKVVLHCFNASLLLLSLAKYGAYFGIGGVLTFKNAKNLVKILRDIPLENLLIETDAPYLTPEPHRGTRNEPVYTKYVASKMAEILNMDVNEIEEITTKNSKKLFKELNSVV
ncbi:TatD family hydrolase [Campylobacter sp. RM12327]|uniref:TatD family hydrolase n=1 Tax=Campylobacter sputorum TaxID=206 RepID=UPI000B796656|nr:MULTISPECIES: TatD family hydrolase [Campylobacter]ASM40655.1 ssDNA/RNA exonuclease, 3' - 5' specific [Campylobacter sputorum]MBE7357680.1 TatD family hydrolase [Campylobacter sp. RM11302]MBF6668958.1 TatD family hydrolase [Campylobacter sp. RM12327]MBF6674033.1 TatD family hydrolase [Campylobacter sp. RM13538]MBF6675936.1 TatD family hydrolase [Campylobacter sp. RM12321]